MVMVHENREILTHNSRRFLVVCNFVPETYTLTASVAVPTHLLKRKYKSDSDQNHNHSIESNVIPVPKPIADTNNDNNNIIDSKSNDIFTFDHYKQPHNVRDSRMLAQHLDHTILNNQISSNTNTNGKTASGIDRPPEYTKKLIIILLFDLNLLINNPFINFRSILESNIFYNTVRHKWTHILCNSTALVYHNSSVK